MPKDTALRQQRLKAWQPILHPVWVIVGFFVLGIVFLPVGLRLNAMSDAIVELSALYDSYELSDLPCGIGETANKGHECTVTIPVTEKMNGPVMVYYEIENFHQNHRRYEQSRDDYQLLGSLTQTSIQKDLCKPLDSLGGKTLNPCGLIANTLFNDIIRLSEAKAADGSNLQMIEKGIAWQSDIEYKFAQPEGFSYQECTCPCDCQERCTGVHEDGDKCFTYFYPNQDTTRYLYETYSTVVSPIEGVKNEHFIVWMRTAALPKFRKLYGWIDNDIPKGTNLTFTISANWEVTSFKGKKSLVVTTTNIFGGKNDYLGNSFLGMAGICIGLGVLFGLKHKFYPRLLADRKYLRYKDD